MRFKVAVVYGTLLCTSFSAAYMHNMYLKWNKSKSIQTNKRSKKWGSSIVRKAKAFTIPFLTAITSANTVFWEILTSLKPSHSQYFDEIKCNEMLKGRLY